MDGCAVPGGLDGVRVLRLPADLDSGTAALVREAVAGALVAGVRELVADVAATVWCPLEGVQALLRARADALAAGAQFRLVSVGAAVRRALELTGTGPLLGLRPDLGAALDGQGAPASG